MKRLKANTGYKVHIRRLIFASNTGTTRTFKFPLVKNCKKQGKKKTTNFLDVPYDLMKTVKHDDLYIRGPSNLVDYIKYKDTQIYTLIDFWLDSLRAGVVFMPSTASLIDFVTKIKDKTSIFEQVINNADNRIKKYFDSRKFIEEFVAKGEIRANKSKQSFVATLNNILNDKTKKNENQLKEALTFITELTNTFFNEKGKVIIVGKDNQNKIWKEHLNLDKELIDISFNSTFFIFPELSYGQDIQITHENLLEVFDKLIDIRKDWLLKHGYDSKHIDKLLDKILGLSDNFNAFSNYFNEIIKNLKEPSGIEQIIDILQKIYKQDVAIIKNKLHWLANKLTNLDFPNIPGVSSWSDYRSLIGGKLTSWWSNHKNRYAEQYEQIQILKKTIDDIIKFINKYPKLEQQYDKQSNLARKESIIEFINQIKFIINDETQIQTNIKKYEALESLIKALRQQLNEYSQLYYINEEGQKTKPNQISYLKDFWELKIYKPRNFYGYAQREKLNKIITTTIPTIKEGIKLVKTLLVQLKDLPNYQNVTKETDKNAIREDAGFRRLLESLARKIKDHKLNTKLFTTKYTQILKKYAPDDKIKNPNKYVFFKSNYSTSTQSEVVLTDINYEHEAKSIITDLTKFLNSFQQTVLLNNPKLLLDWVETAKLTIARMFRWMDQQKKWNLNELNLQIFTSADKFIKQLSSSKVKTPIIRYIIMSHVFSELRGATTIFSKKIVKVKWNIQVIKSDEKFKLFITTKNNDKSLQELTNILKPNNPDKKQLLKDLKWGVSFIDKKQKKRDLLTVLFKANTGKFKISKEQTNQLLQICTSKYHLQFLERLIYKPNNWQNVKIKISEPSLIVEEIYNINWDLNTGLPKLTKTSINKPVLYYAIPMEFTIIRNNKPAQLQKIKNVLENVKKTKDYKLRLKKWFNVNSNIYYLGADIGEYGIAWAIININEIKHTIYIKEYGFEYDKQIRKIQDKFNEIQQKAKKGIFLEASTELAKLRENAIGYLRNKLHNKLIKYKGHIIYEANISGFESGVGRTTKIYDSVKRADIGNHPDVARDIGKQLAKHIWGLKTGGKKNSPGWQVSASGTSYTCINCGQTIYGLGKEKDIWIKIETIVGNIHKFKHINQNITILGYKEKFDKNQIDYKTLRKLAKNFARPPLISVDKDTGKPKPSAAVYQFIIKNNILTIKQLQNIKKKRGNSAIFVCPFEGCHAVTDADIQAAVVIAIRGYLYMKEYYVNKKDKPFSDNNKQKTKNNSNKNNTNEKERLRNLTTDLIKNNNLKGKFGFIYYNGNNNQIN